MKILHITASYKPAFIYGGPIYSVAALCEAVNRVESEKKVKSRKSKVESEKEVESEKLKVESEKEVESLKLKAEGEKQKAESLKMNDESQKSIVNSELNLDKNPFLNENLHQTADYKQDTTVTLQVYTTLANGKHELPYQNNETKIVDGVAVTYFNRLTKDHSHFSPSLLLHLWKNAKQFEVIHIHSWWNLVSMGAVCICLLKGIKPIISPRGMLGDYTMSKSKSAFHRIFGKYLLRKCNFHATTLMEAKEILQQVFNDGDDNAEVVDLMLSKRSKIQEVRSKNIHSNIFIIHNLVKLPKKLPVKTRIFDGTLKLIFLSRIHHKKGIEILLDTLALVDFPFQLSMVGEGDLDYVEKLKLKVESLKLHDKVSWYGAVYYDEKFDLLTNHDAFLLPSYNENFANVVIESIAAGTPVLLSEHVGLKDFVIKNNFGIVFKLEDFKTDLEKFYQLLSKGKFEINRDILLNKENLIHQYLEMYALSSKF